MQIFTKLKNIYININNIFNHVKAILVAYLYVRYQFFMKCQDSRESYCLGSPAGSNHGSYAGDVAQWVRACGADATISGSSPDWAAEAVGFAGILALHKKLVSYVQI